jgi:hypothetical protein
MASGKTTILAIAVTLIVAMGSVGVYLLVSNSGGTGKVSIYVTDLPADWTHVNVTFSDVRIHEASEDNESGWHTLEIHNQTVDLASLTNMSELLASGNVSAGKYTQIRLVVTAVTGTMADGTIVNFTVPSGELKTTHPFNVTAGHTETLTLDFDLSHSIVHESSDWKFKPVLGSITEG